MAHVLPLHSAAAPRALDALPLPILKRPTVELARVESPLASRETQEQVGDPGPLVKVDHLGPRDIRLADRDSGLLAEQLSAGVDDGRRVCFPAAPREESAERLGVPFPNCRAVGHGGLFERSLRRANRRLVGNCRPGRGLLARQPQPYPRPNDRYEGNHRQNSSEIKQVSS